MLDTSLPRISVLMTKSDSQYPRFDLPPGYSLSYYRPGREKQWTQLLCAVGEAASTEEALAVFECDFAPHAALLPTHCVFVDDAQGQPAATASLLPGHHFGRAHPRFHYVATHPAHQGKGLAKALITALLNIHAADGGGFIYLVSSTWSHRALGIYARFGFVPYTGEKPANWPDENFSSNNAAAWALIREKTGLR